MNRINFFIIAFLGLCGAYCNSLSAIAKYNAMPLNFINTTTIKENEIGLAYKIFNRKDCKQFLGREQIISKGYQPIQISISNNTDHTLVLSLENISMPCISYYDIAEAVRFNTAKRVAAWGIPGLFMWPLLIPAAFEAIEAPRANENLLADYTQKSFENEIIKPFNTVNGIIFVNKNQFSSFFSLTLVDSATNDRHTISTGTQIIEIK